MSQNNNGHKPEPTFQSESLLRNVITKISSLLHFRASTSLKESVEEAIEEHDATRGEAFEDGEKAMLRNVLSFAEMNVEDVMIPRADIAAIEAGVSYGELKDFITEKTYTRFPVYRQTLDDVVGFVHIKDLLMSAYNVEKNFNLSKIIRQCLFVPPSMKTSTLLLKMQLSHVHIAIVVDEYGGTDGLVTLEDLVEEIVGEITDEHDRVDDIMFTPLGNDVFEASARIDIEDLEKNLNIRIYTEEEEEDFDSLGGLIFYILGRVPALGEVITTTTSDNRYELEFEITDSDLRRVKRVIIRRRELPQEDDEQVA